MSDSAAPDPTSEFTPELVGRIRRLPQAQQDSIVHDYVTKYYPQVQKWPAAQQTKLFQDFSHKYLGAVPATSAVAGSPAAPVSSSLISTAPLPGLGPIGLTGPAVAAQATGQIYASPQGRAGAELAASPALGAIGAEAIGAPLEAAGFGRLVISLGRALGSTLATTDPSQPNAAKQAGWTFGLNLLGEGLGSVLGRYGSEAERAQAAQATTGAMTPSKVRSFGQIRQLLQSAGKTPEEIDAYLGAAREAGGADTRRAYNAVIQNTRNQFKNDYSSVFGHLGDQEIDTTPISQKMDELEAEIARRGTEDQESPALKRFFDHQRALLAQPGEYPSEIMGAKKGTQEYERLRQQLIGKGQLRGGTANRQTLVQLQGLRSEIRDLRTASASNTTKWASNELEGITTGLMHDALGPEKAPALDEVDSRYRTFENMREAFSNVNSTAFAHEAANALFNAGASKDYESLEHFFTLAQQANKVNPAVMPALRGAFLTKLIGDARLAEPGNLEAQKEFVAKLSQTFRGRVPETMEALFGKGTPFTDIRQMSKVLGSASMPDTERGISNHLSALAKKTARAGGFATSGYFLWRIQYGLIFGTSPWSDLQKDPARFAAGMAASVATGAIAATVLTKGNAMMQRAWSTAMLHPTEGNLNRFFEATAPLAAEGLNQAAIGQTSGALPLEAAPGAGPSPAAAAPPKPRLTFKAGERRTKGGKTYERDEAGRWHPVSS